jgi:hypothetical protein
MQISEYSHVPVGSSYPLGPILFAQQDQSDHPRPRPSHPIVAAAFLLALPAVAQLQPVNLQATGQVDGLAIAAIVNVHDPHRDGPGLPCWDGSDPRSFYCPEILDW